MLRASSRKLIAGFSWKLNPPREPVAQWSYADFYSPGSVLGLAGMFLARRRRETLLIAMAFVSFMGVTAVFWAHTSHRSYLDVYLTIFAASLLDSLVPLGRTRQISN